MKKSTSTSLILSAAAAAGAIYYLFYTEQGIHWRERIVEEVTDTVDGWLETIENQLANAEEKARDAADQN